MLTVYGGKFTRDGTVLIVLAPGVSRRFGSDTAAQSWLRYYRMCGGR